MGAPARIAVVRQAHHWGGERLTAHSFLVLSLSKDGHTSFAAVRQAHHRGEVHRGTTLDQVVRKRCAGMIGLVAF